jgi:glycosyltransferase 2 family protein
MDRQSRIHGGKLDQGTPARHAWWPAVRKWGGIAFIVLVLVLVAKLASGMDWARAWQALQQLPALTLLTGAALAAASHAVYSTYDLIGRHQTGHGLPARRVASVAFVSYAFNLNLGALVGGVAFRYRLYSKLGLATDVISRVLALSMLTNWLGYLVLGGAVLLLAPPVLPEGWSLSAQALPLVGGLLLAVAAAYLGLCLFSRKREWTIRGHGLPLPRARVALLQLALSMINWMLIAGAVWVLLRQQVDYPSVLGALLLAAVAGVLTHVPAGLGVLEAVFLTVLAGRVPQHELLAALLAYRALYYLAPLALAAAMFFWIEKTGRDDGAVKADTAAQPVRPTGAR